MATKPILIVDDSADDAELTSMSLRHAGLVNELIFAEDGVEALDYLWRRGRHANRDPLESPALILMDVNMPRLDGIETLHQLRSDAATRVVPVVILTTSAEEIDLARAYESGANAYVRKPVSLVEFQEAIKRLGLFWIVTNEVPSKPR